MSAEGLSSVDVDTHVHLGLWTDWSRGAVFGRTLTMNRGNANLLIAFTASFVAIVATRFWRILCLAIHRCSSTSGPVNALYCQQQVILRNSSAPENGSESLLRLLWAWRHKPFRQLMHLIGILSIALITAATFIAAGGFSSLISSAVGDVILIDSTNCGFISYQNATNFTSLGGLALQLHGERLSNALNYARQCYYTNSSGMLGCARFVTERLVWTEDTSAPCPFHDSICRTKDSNIRLDTGHIDSNNDLGFNAPGDRRSTSRRVLSCAPLITEGYTSLDNTTVNAPFIRYHHGYWQSGTLEDHNSLNWSYRMGDLESQNARHQGFTSTKGLNFRLVAVPSMTMRGRPYTQNGWRFTPSPEIQRSDGDIAIVYLSSDGVMFNQRMEDEWYRATSPGNLSAAAPNNNVSKEYWRTEEPASPLGCVMQHQYCNPALPKGSDCGPLASFYDAVAGALPLFNSTDEGKFRLQWTFFMHAYGLAQLSELINHLGAASLSSQSQLYDGIQYSLSPRSQWKNDVTYWFATMSAALQAAYLNTVIGPNNSIFDDIRVTPRNDVEQDFCNSQKARSSKYASLSVFGVCFIYVTGGLIIIISFSVEFLLDFLHKRYGYQTYRQLEWTTNQQLQLLRLAQEEAGYGIWTKCTDFVPITITSDDEKLGGLNVAQVDHPCIERMEIQNAATLSYRIETPDNKAATAPFVSVATVNTEGLIERCTTLGGESLEEILISPTSTVVEVPDGEVVMENEYVEP